MAAKVPPGDSFSLWYRMRANILFTLLHMGGPAHLSHGEDPRQQVEKEYLRRKGLRDERKTARRAG